MAESNAPRMVAAMWSVTAVALLFFCMRILFKWRYGKKITLDDGILAFSLCLLTTYTSLIHVATTYGLGSHFSDIPENNLPYSQEYLATGEFFAVLALQVSKTSFAVTLLRLASRTWQTYALWTIIFSLNIVMGIDAIIIFTSCDPVEKIWRPDLPGKCWSPSAVVNVSIFAGVYSGVCDLILAGFPAVLLKPLKIERREKVGVCAAMSLGLFAGIAAFIKSAYLPQLGRWEDVTYSSYIILIWAAAEAAITIVATSMPYLRLAFSDGSRNRGLRVEDEELHMDRIIPNSKTDWTESSVSEHRRVAVPVGMKRHASVRKGDSAQGVDAVPDSWEKYTRQLSSRS